MSASFYNNDIINNTIKDYITRKLKRYGELRYSYMVINKRNPAEMTIISNYPDEWVDIYKKNNYQHIDPVVVTAFNKVAPFSWDENMTVNSSLKLSKIFSYSKKYNVLNGYTFPLHDYNNNLAMLSFMMDEVKIDDTENMLESKKDKLQMLLITIHERFLATYQEQLLAEGNKKPKEKDIFSKRENEILYWASMGKTYQEIGVILGLKTTTIKFHIGNVVKKLGVLNAKHAIRLGVELQLIKPVL